MWTWHQSISFPFRENPLHCQRILKLKNLLKMEDLKSQLMKFGFNILLEKLFIWIDIEHFFNTSLKTIENRVNTEILENTGKKIETPSSWDSNLCRKIQFLNRWELISILIEIIATHIFQAVQWPRYTNTDKLKVAKMWKMCIDSKIVRICHFRYVNIHSNYCNSYINLMWLFQFHHFKKVLARRSIHRFV